jgi:hypothetical protein
MFDWLVKRYVTPCDEPFRLVLFRSFARFLGVTRLLFIVSQYVNLFQEYAKKHELRLQLWYHHTTQHPRQNPRSWVLHLGLHGLPSFGRLFPPFFLRGERLYRTRPCRDKPRSAKRDAPGQDTSGAQRHLSSYFLGGVPRERHRAMYKTDSKWCDKYGGELDNRQTQTLRRTGQEAHKATLSKPGQTRNARMTRNQHCQKNPTETEPSTTHHRADTGGQNQASRRADPMEQTNVTTI